MKEAILERVIDVLFFVGIVLMAVGATMANGGEVDEGDRAEGEALRGSRR